VRLEGARAALRARLWWMFTAPYQEAKRRCDFDFLETRLWEAGESRRSTTVVVPGARSATPETSRFRVWSFGPSRNDFKGKASQGRQPMTCLDAYHRRGRRRCCSTLFARAAGAQSFRSRRTTLSRSGLQILDRALRNTGFTRRPSRRLVPACVGQGPAYFPRGGYLLFSDIPTTAHEVRRETIRTSVFRATPIMPTAPRATVRDVSSPGTSVTRRITAPRRTQDHGAGRQVEASG